jgi:transcriptional regulator GlxA family with amidase domain
VEQHDPFAVRDVRLDARGRHADRRFVDNGRVACSAGIVAGSDMSLHVLARLLGREVAVRTAQQLEYPWQPTV